MHTLSVCEHGEENEVLQYSLCDGALVLGWDRGRRFCNIISVMVLWYCGDGTLVLGRERGEVALQYSLCGDGTLVSGWNRGMGAL